MRDKVRTTETLNIFRPSGVLSVSLSYTIYAHDKHTEGIPKYHTMKLNTKAMRYLTPEDWRTLTAVCLFPRLHCFPPKLTADKTCAGRNG